MLGRELDREILLKLDDADLLNACLINKYYFNTVCDENFFHRRLQQKYSDTLKDKLVDMKYKSWYLDMVYYVAKLKELFNYEYTGGNPKTQLEIFKSSDDIDSLLELSSAKGELSLIKYLVERGADFNVALAITSANGHLEIVKYLIQQGASINGSPFDYIESPLRCSSENGHLEIVKYLIKQGANVNEDNGAALFFASNNGHLEVIKYLLSKGAIINNDSLMLASRKGYLEVVKYLVEQGVDIHSHNDRALNAAYTSGHSDVFNYLKSLP